MEVLVVLEGEGMENHMQDLMGPQELQRSGVEAADGLPVMRARDITADPGL